MVGDLMKPRSVSVSESHGSGALDYRKSQFRDLMEFVSPGELHEPVRGNLHELDVTVQSVRNVTLR